MFWKKVKVSIPHNTNIILYFFYTMKLSELHDTIKKYYGRTYV